MRSDTEESLVHNGVPEDESHRIPGTNFTLSSMLRQVKFQGIGSGGSGRHFFFFFGSKEVHLY